MRLLFSFDGRVFIERVVVWVVMVMVMMVRSFEVIVFLVVERRFLWKFIWRIIFFEIIRDWIVKFWVRLWLVVVYVNFMVIYNYVVDFEFIDIGYKVVVNLKYVVCDFDFVKMFLLFSLCLLILILRWFRMFFKVLVLGVWYVIVFFLLCDRI